ncbi:MAG: tRNA pseudouridine(54/55) synthase Pus10 [Desulfurococcaceae archaeon]
MGEIGDSGRNFMQLLENMLKKAEQVLYEYPLCNSCLGRLFSQYGKGLTNWERGLAVKTILAIKLYDEYMRGERSTDDRIRAIALNAGEGVLSMYKKVFGDTSLVARPCYICGGNFTRDLLGRIAIDVCKELTKYSARSFLIGVVLSSDIFARELELTTKYGLSTAESIKRELKREVGKQVREVCGLEPDFTRAEAVAIVHVDKNFVYHVEVQPAPIYIKGLYWKHGRRISHVPWYTKQGLKKYSLSVQEAVEHALIDVFKAENIVVHGAGREDVDARMIGTGRPLVLEVKKPMVRDVEISDLNKFLYERLKECPVKLALFNYSLRRDVRLIKELSRKKKKIYRLVVYSLNSPVIPEELRLLEEYFRNITIRQKTPLRVLRRKKEKERIRKVYIVKTYQVSPRIFETLVYCDGGLYVKELVHCDQGRTVPCFAGVLGKQLLPLELDVVGVEE